MADVGRTFSFIVELILMRLRLFSRAESKADLWANKVSTVDTVRVNWKIRFDSEFSTKQATQ